VKLTPRRASTGPYDLWRSVISIGCMGSSGDGVVDAFSLSGPACGFVWRRGEPGRQPLGDLGWGRARRALTAGRRAVGAGRASVTIRDRRGRGQGAEPDVHRAPSNDPEVRHRATPLEE